MKAAGAAWCALIGTLLTVPAPGLRGAADLQDTRAVLPDAADVPGWRAVEAPRVFKGEDLYEMIDGGADLYLEYGFTEAAVARYAAPSQGTLQVEVYRMADDAAAYGVYSANQAGQGTPLDIGQAARQFDYYLAMWKGDCFVSITVTDSAGDARSALRRAATATAARIQRSGEVPSLLSRLPARDLVEKRFFRGPLGAANCYPFAGNDPFRVREGACGFYPGLRLLLFRYPDAEQAAARLTDASRALVQTGAYRDLVSGPDGFACLDADANRIAARVEGDCIAVRVRLALTAGNK